MREESAKPLDPLRDGALNLRTGWRAGSDAVASTLGAVRLILAIGAVRSAVADVGFGDAGTIGAGEAAAAELIVAAKAVQVAIAGETRIDLAPVRANVARSGTVRLIRAIRAVPRAAVSGAGAADTRAIGAVNHRKAQG